MIAFSNRLYHSLQNGLAHLQKKPLLSLEEIECYFQRSYWHWAVLYKKFVFYRFSGMEEEVHFFKSIKPLFTAQIEYAQLLYHAQLFIPDGREEARLRFLQMEAERLSRFIQDHASFYQYYKSGATCQDALYFTRSANSLLTSLSKPYEDQHLFSLYDPLVARLLSLEPYIVHVNNCLKNLQ